jgi:hypothetical protein
MIFASKKAFVMGSGSHGSELPPENDKPPVFLLGFFILLMIGFLVAVGIASKQLLITASDADIEEKQGPNPELVEMRATEDATLTSYDLVDKPKGWYRIPIGTAIEEYAKTAEK